MKQIRMNKTDRRASILQGASAVLAEDGLEAVRIPTVAKRVQVSRPVVYAHFKNRREIIVAILQDYEEELQARFEKALSQAAPNLESGVSAVLEATCAAIEVKGPGAWNLLGAAGSDPVIEKQANRIRQRIWKPWTARIRNTTHTDKKQAQALTHITGMVTRAVIDLWINGKLKKEEAIQIGLTSVVAMLRAFREPARGAG